MASFDTVETTVIKSAGYTPALTIIYGTYASSAGATGGVISPGYNNANGTFTSSGLGSIGCRRIVGFSYTPSTEDATTPKQAIAFDATRDRFDVTFTSVANATGTYKIECIDNGA